MPLRLEAVLYEKHASTDGAHADFSTVGVCVMDKNGNVADLVTYANKDDEKRPGHLQYEFYDVEDIISNAPPEVQDDPEIKNYHQHIIRFEVASAEWAHALFMVHQSDKHISLGIKEHASNAADIDPELPAWKLKVFESDSGDEIFD